MTSPQEPAEKEFLALAERALSATDTTAVLDELGWWDLLPQLDNPELRTAVFAVFRAQGAALANSPALGGLLAQPYLRSTATASGPIVATALRHSPRRGPVPVVVGDVRHCQLLIDRPGQGVWIADAAELRLRRIEIPGRLVLHEVEIDEGRWRASISERECSGGARRRSTFLGRVALALEILGAAEAAGALSVEYASQREQFGEPIGHFQAIRHLLAWARTDCEALASVTREAVLLDAAAPPRYDEVVKALAGRNGRRACERALQVLGGIGFTTEHKHHHFHGRVLALDALLGTSAELIHGLGSWLRSAPAHPGFPEAVLLRGQ
jgi:Acyl-CoA dehydrogenase, C-terminal domain